MIEDSLCTEDVSGEKPAVAKPCNEGGSNVTEPIGPQVSTHSFMEY